MPIYKYEGKKYNIPEDKVAEFERAFPNATVVMYAGDKTYNIPVSKQQAFKTSFDDASYNPIQAAADVEGVKTTESGSVVVDEAPKKKRITLADTLNASVPGVVNAEYTEAVNEGIEREVPLTQEEKDQRAATSQRLQEDGTIDRMKESKKEARHEKISALGRMMSVAGSPSAFVPNINGGTWDDVQEGSTEYRQNKLLQEKLDVALDMARAGENQDGLRGVENFGLGLWDSASRLSTWDFGYSDIVNNLTLQQIVEKWENDPSSLTATEKKVLEGIGMATAVQELYSGQVGIGYNVGQSLPESASFMMGMALNPASGLGKSLARNAVRTYGRNAVGKIAARRALGDLAETAIMTATTGAGRVAADALERINGSSTYEIGKNGVIMYGGQKDQETVGDAVLKAIGNNFIENYSEALGEYFDPLLGMSRKVAAGGLRKMNLNKWADALSDVQPSQMTASIRALREKTKFGGIFGEVMEEEIGMALNTLFVGDNQWGDFVDLETQLTTVLSCAIMSGTLSGVEQVSSVAARRKMEKNAKNAEQEASYRFSRDKFAPLREAIDQASPEGMVDVLRDVYMSQEYTVGQKRALAEYAAARLQLQYYNAADAKARRQVNKTQQELLDAQEAGLNAQLPQFFNIARAAQFAEDELLDYDGDWNLVDIIRSSMNRPEEMERILGDLPPREAQLVTNYIYSRARMEGAYQGRSNRAEDYIDDFAYALEPAVVTDAEGNRTITTALLGDRSVYVLDNNGDLAHIMRPDGSKTLVKASELTNITTSSAEEVIDRYRDMYTSEYNAETENAFNHHPKTQAPQVGLQLQSPEGEVVITAVNDNMVEIVPAVYKDGQVQPKEGAEPRTITVDDAYMWQDSYYQGLDDAAAATASQPTVDNMSAETAENEGTPSEQIEQSVSEEVTNGQIAETQPTETESIAPAEPQTARERVPKDDKGNPIYEQTDADTAWDAIMEETEGNVEMAQSVAEQMLANKKAALEKLQKGKAKAGANVAQIIANEKKHQEAIAKAEADVKAWERISQVNAIRQQRAELERAAAEKAEAEQRRAEEIYAEDTDYQQEIATFADENQGTDAGLREDAAGVAEAAYDRAGSSVSAQPDVDFTREEIENGEVVSEQEHKDGKRKVTDNAEDVRRTPLSELEYVKRETDRLFNEREDQSLSREEWELADEGVDAENAVIDSYPSYIQSLSDSGELQRMFDLASVGEEIQIRRAVEAAGFELDDVVDTSVKRANAKAARDKKRAEKAKKLIESVTTNKEKQNGAKETIPEGGPRGRRSEKQGENQGDTRQSKSVIGRQIEEFELRTGWSRELSDTERLILEDVRKLTDSEIAALRNEAIESIERGEDVEDIEIVLNLLEKYGRSGERLYILSQSGIIPNQPVLLDKVEQLFMEYNEDEGLAILFDRLRPIIEQINPKITFEVIRDVDGNVKDSTVGDFYLKDNHLRFNLHSLNSSYQTDQEKASTIVHEMIHAITQYAIDANERGDKTLPKNVLEAAKSLVNIYNQIKDNEIFNTTQVDDKGNIIRDYGVKDVHEMISELANPEFREKLKQIDVKGKNAWERIIDAIARFINQFKDIYDTTAYGKAVRALDTLMDNFNLDAYEQSMVMSDGQALCNIRTYREFGRDRLQAYVGDKVAEGILSAEDGADIIQQMDDIYEAVQKYTDVYAPFGNWSEAEVVMKDGRPVFSVVKTNGDYKMNLDFSLVCKKRRTLDAVFDELIKRGAIENVSLEQVDIARINDIIRDHAFEVACSLCFVDAKRFRIAEVADDFCKMYNELVDKSDKQLQSIVNKTKKNTVRKKIAQLLLDEPSNRIKLSRENFMSAKGFDDMKVNAEEIMKLYNAKKGTGGPKASSADVQYHNDVLDKNWTPEAAYSVGGVRLQSFSDYVPRLVFDYIQMIADLSAKQLPVHAYTKEELFARQFGLTGIKINMSLVPSYRADGVAAGLDKDGNYVWEQGQTFDYNEAVEIQNADGYRENCGTIAVGVSDAHISKMLDDENIRMVIPYHKSGINKKVAVHNHIDKFTDYTNEQSTRDAKGKKLSKEMLKDEPNFNENLRKLGDPRAAAQAYLDWCDEKGYLPKFDKWRNHPNYYKLLEDFTTIIPSESGEQVVPQRGVTMTFPNEGNAFGSLENLIARGLEEDAVLEGRRDKEVPVIADEVESELRFRDGAPFFSNAERAVENIKQQKATPEQWLAMIKKDGGLKAGEDKWMGLSDWLNEQKEKGVKTLTKDEVLAFIRENQIEIEEVEYESNPQSFEDLKDEYEAMLRDEGYDAAHDAMVDRFGDDFDIAFEDLGGELAIANEEAAATLLGSGNIINSTRLDYTTEGLDNKREIALVVPTIEPWNQSDTIHFGDAGEGRAVAWVRFGETIDEDGKRVLVIDEVQSKRHDEGRSKGYSDLRDYDKKMAALEEEAAELLARRNKLIKVLDEKYGGFTKYLKHSFVGQRTSLVPNPSVMTAEEIKEWNETSQDSIREREDELKKLKRGIPDAPFDKNYHELVMKRMLRYAAENGFDKVAWTKGAQQAERYNLAKRYDYFEREDNPNEEGRRFVFASHANADVFRVNDEGVVIGASIEEAKGKTLTSVVGSELAEQMMSLENGDIIDKKDIVVGGEDRNALYDEMIPRFMNKYVKKWGTTVGEVTLPNVEEAGRTMWSVDVTDSMRESVMQGQPMFREGEGAISDREVSYENDPIAKFMGKPRYYGKRAAAFAERERRRMENSAKEAAEMLGIEAEIVTDASTLQGRKAKAKGWYDIVNKKVVVVVPNHASMGDAVRTVLHEGIAHHGLRELFGDGFDAMIDNVYNNVAPELKARIDAIAERTGVSTQVATEEYLASLAETTNFEEAQRRGWWQQIKRFFVDMLNKLAMPGLNLKEELTDNELRYLLWRSYKNLVEPNSYAKPLGFAEDVVKQKELKVGEYAEKAPATPMAAEMSEAEESEAEEWAAITMQRIEELEARMAQLDNEIAEMEADRDADDASRYEMWEQQLEPLRKQMEDVYAELEGLYSLEAEAEEMSMASEDAVRFRLVDDPEVIAELEASPKRTGYRNVVLNEDGTFSSPMAYWLQSINGGAKTRVEMDKFELGQWEEAQENIDLVDENGHVALVKPDKGTVKVAYDPYIHNRLEPVNLQFKDAWKRDDLVYVETEVAETDLNSGYHAEKAKLPVGIHSWSNGDVMLSKYDKPVRIMPWEEVADAWADRLNGEGVNFDRVPKAMRSLLEERGVEILPPTKNMGKDCNDAYKKWREENPKKERNYTLSNKKDNEGNVFFETNGSIDLWNISSLLKKARRQDAPIRLTDANMKHIIDSHKAEIGGSEKDVFRFLDNVFSNAYTLRKAKGRAMFVVVEKTNTDKAAIIKLYPSNYGDYYNVESAGYYRKDKWKNTEEVIAELSEPTLSDTASDVSKPQASNNSGRMPLNAETATISADKVSNNSSAVQEKNVKSRNSEEIVSEVEREAAALGVPVRIARSVDELPDEDTRKRAEDGKLKGYFDPRTGEVVLYEPNTNDANDAKRTILHEIVGHKGLRQLIGEQRYDKAMLQLMYMLPADVRDAVLRRAERHGWNAAIAMDEYLADQAERDVQPTWWGKVNAKIRAILRNIGFDVKLTDADVTYLLWRSRKKLQGDSLNDMAVNAILKQAARKSAEAEAWNEQAFKDMEMRDFERNTLPSIRHRMGADTNDYEKAVRTLGFKQAESWQDSMRSLLVFQQALAKASGKDISDFENAYMYENRMSSANLMEMEQYRHMVYNPLLKEIHELEQMGASRDSIINYLFAKSGLERNEVFARRDAKKHAEGDATKEQQLYDKYRQKDYAGLTALTRGDAQIAALVDDHSKKKTEYERLEQNKKRGVAVSDADLKAAKKEMNDARKAMITAIEAEAQRMVDEFEAQHNTDNLWDKIRNCTHTTLNISHDAGVMSDEVYNELWNQFQYYIPLRGFAETTAEDVYLYLGGSDSPYNAPIKTAYGRTSLADDPIATIGNMAESAIVEANRNRLKQRFLYMVERHNTDLASISNVWLEYDDVNDEWHTVFAQIPDDATPSEAKRLQQEFEDRMKQLAEQNPGKYANASQQPNIPYRVVKKKNQQAHHIVVKRNGKDVVITINGNPRVAQAINGLTNPEQNQGMITRITSWINRNLSANFTMRNPAFMVSNFVRDGFYTNSMVWVKENPAYAWQYNQNWMKCTAQIASLVSRYKRYEKGDTTALDMNNDMDRMFYEFMINGGETGYTVIKSVEDYKGLISGEMKKMEAGAMGTARRVADKIGDVVDTFDRWAEDTSRFAAYMTSRQLGRTITKSIWDAKEISVNFNKKGSGNRMMGKFEQGNRLNYVLSNMSQLGRNLYVFWNAGVQGFNNFKKAAKDSPAKFTAMAGTYFTLGVIVAAAFSGDDDEDDYYNLPEYVRRNNICFKIGKGKYATLPLPIEIRAIYGLGELAYSYLSGREGLTHGEAVTKTIQQMTQVMPIDMMADGGGAMALVPSAAKPVVEVIHNVDWTGRPIYKEKTPWNQNDPTWTLAFKSTSPELVQMSRLVNEWTNKNTADGLERPYNRGWADNRYLNNPAVWEHIAEGYLGGVATMFNQTKKTLMWPFNKDVREVRNIPIVSRFVKDAGTEGRSYAARNEYYEAKNIMDSWKNEISKAKKEEFDENLTDEQRLKAVKLKESLEQQYMEAAERWEELDRQRKDLEEAYKSDQSDENRQALDDVMMQMATLVETFRD